MSSIIIIGAGIGGLSLALELHARGYIEASPSIRPIGVGINIQNYASRELHRLGIARQLRATSILPSVSAYASAAGQILLKQPLGLSTGSNFPQYSIHRAALQSILLEAVQSRLGEDAIRFGRKFVRFEQDKRGVEAFFDGDHEAASGDILEGSDGVYSSVCQQLHPNAIMLRHSGITMWRGVTRNVSMLDQQTMLRCGRVETGKLVAYPIRDPQRPDEILMNWIAEFRDGLLRRERHAQVSSSELPEIFLSWKFDWLNVAQLICNSNFILQLPMMDRHPLPYWSRGRVTLLGDAAHPMYLVGSNGAGQAILGAAALAECLDTVDNPVASLRAYDAQRRPATTKIVRRDRAGGPDVVLDAIYEETGGAAIPPGERAKIGHRLRNLLMSHGGGGPPPETKSTSWCSTLPPELSSRQREWVGRSGSLTDQLHTLGEVTVEVQREFSGPADADASAPLAISPGDPVWTREVLLLVDGVPMVAAHSVTPLADSKNNWGTIRHLNATPLIEILFREPVVHRSPFQYRTDHQAPHACPDDSGTPLCTRRSQFFHNGTPLLVTECFLPLLWRKLSLPARTRFTPHQPESPAQPPNTHSQHRPCYQGACMKTASEELSHMIFMWKWGSQSLCAAATLGLFDHLDQEQPQSAERVAEAAEVDAVLLYRLLRALASLGLLDETHDQCFTLTERGDLLRTDAPGSLRYMAMLEGGPEHWAIWKHVPAMIRDGRQNAFVREFGKMAFDHAREHPDGYGAIFGRAMSSFSAVQSEWALEAMRDCDLSRISTWCDVAGGHGHTMCAFLNAYPHLTGTVLDLPEVIAEEEQLWAPKLNLDKRCHYITGDMFREVPVEADAYSLKMILHDWSDDECVQILRNIRQRARPDSRVFIVEHIVPKPSEPHFAKLFDIQMMCWGTGRERTETEYAALLEFAGWRFAAAHYPPHANIGVIEGTAA